MLTLTIPYFEQVQAGIWLNGNSFWSNTNVSTSLGLGLHSPYRDLFGEDLCRTVIPLGFRSMRYLMGQQSSDDPTPTFLLEGLDPDSTTPEYARRVERWSTYLSHLGFLFGNTEWPQDVGKERGIHHLNTYGGLNVGSASGTSLQSGTLPTGVKLDPTTLRPVMVWWGGSPTETIFSFLRRKDLSDYSVSDAGKHTRYYGLNWSYVDGHLQLSYYYRYQIDTNEGCYYHVYRIDWDVQTQYRVNPTSPGVERSCNDFLTGDIVVKFKIIDNHFTPNNGDPVQYSQYRGQGGTATMRYYWDIYAGFCDWITESDMLSQIGYSPITREYSDSGLFSFKRFWSVSQGVVPDAYPLSFFAAKAAVDGYLETMKANHIEFLNDLGSWLSLVDLVAAVARLRKGVVLPQLIKLLADARLAYSFGIAPTLSDAKDIAEKAHLIQSRLDALTQPQLIHGSFSMDVPAALSPLPLSMVVHSKLRVRLSPDSFLTGALSLRSVGLLPSPSSLWDCIPWSFLVDWFLHLGEYTEDVEFSAMMLCLAVEFSVNSVLLYHQFDSEFLAEHNSTAFSTDTRSIHLTGAGYRLFSRWPQMGFPALSPSRLLPYVHGVASIPDWGNFASLIVQKIKG